VRTGAPPDRPDLVPAIREGATSCLDLPYSPADLIVAVTWLFVCGALAVAATTTDGLGRPWYWAVNAFWPGVLLAGALLRRKVRNNARRCVRALSD
jgi:hypothetical protein